MSTSCRWTSRSTSKPSSTAFTTRTTFQPSSKCPASGHARAIGSHIWPCRACRAAWRSTRPTPPRSSAARPGRKPPISASGSPRSGRTRQTANTAYSGGSPDHGPYFCRAARHPGTAPGRVQPRLRHRAFPDAVERAGGSLGGALPTRALDGAGDAAIPDDLRARLARCDEEYGLGGSRSIRRLGDQNPAPLDQPPPQRLRTHSLRGTELLHVVAIITAKPGMRDAILKEFHANMP